MNTTAQDEITTYVDAVRAALAGLPEATRDELVEDLPEHLAEVLAEGDGPLIDRLGDPARYAADLCAAAGLTIGAPAPPPASRLAALRATALRYRNAADRRVGPLLGYPLASDFFVLLRPAWWVLRGYLAAMVLAFLLDDSGQPMGLLPRIGGSEPVALVLLVGAILASVWLGRRTANLTHWPRYALRAGTLLLVLVALTGFLNADSDTRGAGYAAVGYDDPYQRISDVFVYDQQGRLVTGARLFDQQGQPIRLGNPWWCEAVGSSPANDEPVYPYCPDHAPWSGQFRPPDVPPPPGPTSLPTAQPSLPPSPEPTAGPSLPPSPGPTPPSAGPSISPRLSPPAAGPALSSIPSPSR